MAELRRRHPAPTEPRPPVTHGADRPTAVEARARAGGRNSSVPRASRVLLAFVLFHAATLATIGHFHTWLPPPEALDAPPDRFSEARARVVLENIMRFGYRPVGSKANDELTPAYLLREIEKIKAAAPAGVSVEVDVQKPTGAFGLRFLATFQNIYANVTNIVVRVTRTPSPSNANAAAGDDVLNNSLMFSSHYDAALGAAAASDDGVNIAIMMELLRYFAMSPPTHGSLIFNFNSAEETVLQAAHGGCWRRRPRALFQTSSDELALAYAEGAKYPHASIIGQEVFQTGVIPSDTDFRIYRDFGEIPGMDIAYIANGYVYHTMLDDISRIQHGAIQRLGDNIVGVVQRLVNEPGRLAKIASSPYSSNTLFFDVAGQFMVTLDRATVFRLCMDVAIFALVYLLCSPITFRQRMSALQLMCQCIGAGLGASLVVGVFLTLFAPLSWYTQPFFGAVTFLAPTLAAMCDRLAAFLARKIPSSDLKATSETLWRVEESMFEAMLSTWLVVLAILLSQNIISSYAVAIWILFPLLGQIICRVLQRVKLRSSSVYVLISLLAVVFPVLHSGFVLVLAFMFFLPLLGRSGTVVPPDVVVAVLFALSFMIMASFSSRFFCFVSPRTLRSLRNILLAVSGIAVVLSTLANPYSKITPKRLIVQHVQREARHPNGSVSTQDAGLWLNAMDFRGLSPLRQFLARTQWQDAALIAPPKTLVDKLGLYGDMPFGKPIRDFLPERHSWYLPAKPPVFTKSEHIPDIQVISTKYDATTNRRMIHLLFTGPAHLGIFIDATATQLTSWSMGEGVSGPAPHKNGTYILQFATGTPPAAFHFWLETESNRSLEMGIVGHHLEKTTPEMRDLREAMPAWAHCVEFVSTWSTRWI